VGGATRAAGIAVRGAVRGLSRPRDLSHSHGPRLALGTKLCDRSVHIEPSLANIYRGARPTDPSRTADVSCSKPVTAGDWFALRSCTFGFRAHFVPLAFPRGPEFVAVPATLAQGACSVVIGRCVPGPMRCAAFNSVIQSTRWQKSRSSAYGLTLMSSRCSRRWPLTRSVRAPTWYGGRFELTRKSSE